jgi:hypothetical protein
MARGWESKSVEAQQAEASAQNQPARPKLTAQQVEHKRKLEGLTLSRRRVEGQLVASRDPRHQAMLRKALADLDAEILELTHSTRS